MGQVGGSAQTVQLFDSWPASLVQTEFERWVVARTAAIRRLMVRYPDVPIIGFPKGAGAKLAAYAAETWIDTVGLDETVDPAWAGAMLAPKMPVQGNIDPLVLRAGGEAPKTSVAPVRTAYEERPHIQSWPGHPPGHADGALEALLAMVRGGTA